MLQKALQKLQAEIIENDKLDYVDVLGGFLIKHVQDNPTDAEKIMTEGKTIVGSLKVLEEEAKKNKKGNTGILTPDKVFNIVLQYYGVHVPEVVLEKQSGSSFDANLDELLSGV